MSDRRLLDTNIISDLVRRPAGPAASRLLQTGDDAVCTNVIVAAELRFGAAKRGSDRLTRQLEQVLAAIEILPLSPPVDHLYGEVRTRLELAGTPIGGNDMLIAAHALALDFILVTDNEREFSRVAGLRIENWLR
ncbi:MAG: type II toxin-antitoxin system VapC family toxin [Caulobacter sp.]|nr:type II toxin-antitoxin system VapC family toxin [Caulobacter sp.]